METPKNFTRYKGVLLTPELHQRLTDYALSEGISSSGAVRQILIKYFNRQDGEGRP